MNISAYTGSTIEHPDDNSYDIFSEQPLYGISALDGLSEKIRYEEKMNGATYIYIDSYTGNEVLYLFFSVHADRNRRTIFDALITKNTKIWNNGKLVLTVGVNMENEDENYISHPFMAELTEGNNDFVVEIYHPQRKNAFLLQILDYAHHSVRRVDTMSNIKAKWNYEDLNIISSSMIWSEDGTFTFRQKIDDDIKDGHTYLSILDYDDNILYSCYCPVDKIITLKKSDFKKYETNILDVTFFRFSWRDSKGRYHQHCIHVIPRDIEKIIDYLQNEYDQREEWQNDPSILWHFDLIKKYVYEIHSIISAFWECYNMYKTKIRDQKPKVIRIKPENMDKYDNIYYTSEIDLQDERIMVRLPRKFDKSKAYPLVLHIAIGQYGWEGYVASLYPCFDRCIYADVSIKGQTLGNYMGEACFFENLERILEKYHIDRDRIYLVGASNGAYAAWRLAIKYPYLFAGVFPVAGYPQISQIDNITNIHILNMLSDKDYVYAGKEDEILMSLSDHRNYKQVNVQNMLHCQMLKFAVNPAAFIYLKRFVRDQYPNEIHYVSSQYRYRKAYWLTLGMISDGHHQMRGDICLRRNNTQITANITGTDSFSLELPPQVVSPEIDVIINEKRIHIILNGRRNLFFVQKEGSFCEDDHLLLPEFSHKGIGVVGVYFDPLTIVIGNKEIGGFEKIAQKLATPSSNVNDGQIRTKYPIVRMDEWNRKDDRSAILIELLDDDRRTPSIPVADCYIKCTPDGFAYDSKFYEGKYVVMQIVPHPYVKGRSVLLISGNNEKTIRSQIYLRNMNLTSDCFSLNPYLNNEALIFLNGKYSKVYSWGDEIKEVVV